MILPTRGLGWWQSKPPCRWLHSASQLSDVQMVAGATATAR